MDNTAGVIVHVLTHYFMVLVTVYSPADLVEAQPRSNEVQPVHLMDVAKAKVEGGWNIVGLHLRGSNRMSPAYGGDPIPRMFSLVFRPSGTQALMQIFRVEKAPPASDPFPLPTVAP